MKPTYLKRFVAVAVLALAANILVFAQKPLIDEKNVRAEMYFLASDAMEGRGSGTPFERVTAEYIGSQFMEFGLEPAGESGFDGKPTYVQTVPFTPCGGGDQRHTWNAIGKLTGSDPKLSSEVILISSHL